MLPLVSLTGALAIYLALELDRSWTEITHLRVGRAAVAKALLFGRQFRRLTYPSARKRIVPDCASGLVRTDFPPVLYNMCAYVRSTRTRVGAGP